MRVLVLDDSAVGRIGVQLALEPTGWPVHLFPSARALWAQYNGDVAAMASVFEAAVVDLWLARDDIMGGLTVAQHLVAHLPVVLVTACPECEDLGSLRGRLGIVVLEKGGLEALPSRLRSLAATCRAHR